MVVGWIGMGGVVWIWIGLGVGRYGAILGYGEGVDNNEGGGVVEFGGGFEGGVNVVAVEVGWYSGGSSGDSRMVVEV